MISNKLLNEKGSALLITMLIMSMLTLVGTMAVERSTVDIELSYNQLHEEQAFYIAEAGFKLALSEIVKDADWRDGFPEKSLGEGVYSVTIYDSIVNPSLGDTIIIEATGKVEKAETVVEAWIVPETNYPFRRALFGDKSVLLENNVCTDSYIRGSGIYVVTQLDSNGDIGSNTSVSIKNKSTIGGNVESAIANSISLSINSTVIGDTITGVDSVLIDLVSDSEYTWAQINSIAPAGFSGSGYSYNPDDGKLSVTGKGSLILDDGIYYFSDISLKNKGKITPALSASVTIYMTGDLTLENQSAMNKDGNPRDLIIYSKGTKIIIGNLTSFSGAILAPNALFSLANNSNVYGSVVARNIAVANHACFHYARNLGDISKGNTGNMLLAAWREQ